jgi:hypothetical protein
MDMMTKQETDWRNLFAVEELSANYSPLPTQPGECNANCQTAKELVCVCKCKGRNHGNLLKKHVKPLDQFSEKETYEDPAAASFNPEEYLEEMVLA